MRVRGKYYRTKFSYHDDRGQNQSMQITALGQKEKTWVTKRILSSRTFDFKNEIESMIRCLPAKM